MLDNNKASGPDGISTRMLKNTAHAITLPLSMLFNLSILSGTIPQEWKVSNVVPVHKGGERSDPSNYRPISLLSVISKTMEKHLYGIILDHLIDTDFLSENQWGFRSKLSTGIALLLATNDWFSYLDKSKEVGAVSLT